MTDNTVSTIPNPAGADARWRRSGEAFEEGLAGVRVNTDQPSLDTPARELHGRHAECQALDRLVMSARAGQSRALVIRGEAGVGKTALLEFLAERGSDCRIARAAGVESETELAFAGLHQLCAPFLDQLSRLPDPQRDALSTAFGLSAGDPPDRFRVGLAVLSLLAEVAEQQPLICLIDDAQWFDRVSAQTLAFVARRLLAERVALVFAVRELSDEHELAGLQELVLRGLVDSDARALLGSVVQGPLDAAIRDRIVAETRGNPLALLELPRGLTPAELAGGFGLSDAMPMASRIEQGFLRRLEPLPDQTRLLLLTAAVEPLGDAALLSRAAVRLQIGSDAAVAAQTAGLIELGAHVRFRHPLVRSAVCRAASEHDLRVAHAALADETDPVLDPDRKAWHRSSATSGPDEDVAEALERSAGRAQGRGGVAAAAAFLERATALTADPVRRGARALEAAQASHLAGAPGTALRLLAATDIATLDELQGARVELLRAQIALTVNRGRDAPALLLTAARRLEPLDVGLARNTYRDALSAALFAGRLAIGQDMLAVAQAARRAPQPTHQPRKDDMLLDGRAMLFTEGYRAATPVLKQVMRAYRDEDISAGEGLRWIWLAHITAEDLWDDESSHILAAKYVKAARELGALSELPIALTSHVFVHLFAGEVTAAAALATEAQAVMDATRSNFTPYAALGVAVWSGQEEQARELAAVIMSEVVPRGEGLGVTFTQYLVAVLANASGRYDEALVAAQEATANPQELGPVNWGLSELIEAGTRTGQIDLATKALTALSVRASGRDSEWALGIEARCRALLSDGVVAEGLYREAIERLGRTRIRVELARAHLLYGEWLRRENRRVDAREQLRAAHEMFLGMGVEAFAERASRELLATGETVRKRSIETRDELTAQEAQIARLAAAGRTNPEIGAELFISPRTVEWHLRKVFPKLEISSRRELSAALANA